VFAVGALIAFNVSNELYLKFNASSDIPSRGKVAMEEINSHYSGVIDNSFVLVVIGLFIGIIAFAMLIRVHPVFLPIYVLVLIIVVVITAALSNVYLNMANTAELSGVATKLTFITHLFGVLPYLIGVFGFVLAIIMYKTWQNSQ